MKIVNALPPNIAALQAAGLCPDPATTCFTWGDTLYHQGGQFLEGHFMAHEEFHSRQQGDNPDGWWHRYIVDPLFRVDQEAQAYAVQYLFFNRHVSHDRNVQYRFLNRISASLSGPTYGKVVGQTAAMRLIQSYAGKLKV